MEIKREYLDALKSKGADIILWDQRYQREMLDKFAA